MGLIKINKNYNKMNLMGSIKTNKNNNKIYKKQKNSLDYLFF